MNISPISTNNFSTKFVSDNAKRSSDVADIAFKANSKMVIEKSKTLAKSKSIQNCFNDIIVSLKNIKKFFSKSKELQVVANPVLLYFTGLQTKREFLDEYNKKLLTGEYINPDVTETVRIVRNLEGKNIINSLNFPDYEVMVSDGLLTNTAYYTIRDFVNNASYGKLADSQKLDILNKLARCSYHTEDVSYSLNFTGSSHAETMVSTDNDVDIGIADSDDGSLLDAILDFIDDLF